MSESEALDIIKRYDASLTLYSLQFGSFHLPPEDLKQEVIIRFFQYRHKYDPSKGKPSTYLMRLSKNIAIESYRSRNAKKRISHTLPIIEDFVKASQLDHYDHDTPIIWNEIKKHLKEWEFHVLRLRVEGFSYKEITKILNINESTARVSVNRSRESLKSVIQAVGY